MFKFKECADFSDATDKTTAFVFQPKDHPAEYYSERTDRNIGWITKDEQRMVRGMKLAIAGVGGMGGQIAQIMVRLGVGEIRIADPESFDISNINRQFAAGLNTIGHSKAIETGRLLRNISDDYRLVIFPQGVRADIIEDFLDGVDVIIDEIEFWNIGSCILMHQLARKKGIPILNCLTVGFATYLHLFTPTSTPVEEMLGISLEEALDLERRMLDRSISSEDQSRLMRITLQCFIPNLPNYYSGEGGELLNAAVIARLEDEGKAPIISTNPPVAAGIAANRALLLFLNKKGVERDIAALPSSPGYFMFDSATFIATAFQNRT